MILVVQKFMTVKLLNFATNIVINIYPKAIFLVILVVVWVVLAAVGGGVLVAIAVEMLVVFERAIIISTKRLHSEPHVKYR